jgi:hypothetical protein
MNGKNTQDNFYHAKCSFHYTLCPVHPMSHLNFEKAWLKTEVLVPVKAGQLQKIKFQVKLKLKINQKRHWFP